MTAYLEHAAIHVSDLSWFTRFIETVFAMPATMHEREANAPVQVWLLGGLQLIADRAASQSEPVNHLALATAEPETAIARARGAGAASDARGENWLCLPDGVVIEILEAPRERVRAARALDPRAAGGADQ